MGARDGLGGSGAQGDASGDGLGAQRLAQPIIGTDVQALDGQVLANDSTGFTETDEGNAKGLVCHFELSGKVATGAVWARSGWLR